MPACLQNLSILLLTLLFPIGGCAAKLGGLADPDPDPIADGAAVFDTVPDTIPIDPDTGLPQDTAPAVDITPDTADASDPDTRPAPDAADAAPGETGTDPPGIVRCGPASTACDLRGTGNACCLITLDGSSARRCVGPDEPVPGDVCPAPAWCDDGADCQRTGDSLHVHCCRQPATGAAACRSACVGGEVELL